MNPWAEIDALKKKHADEVSAAVAEITALGFKGAVADRLQWDGTHWRFPVSGEQVKSRSLSGLVAALTSLKGGKS